MRARTHMRGRRERATNASLQVSFCRAAAVCDPTKRTKTRRGAASSVTLLAAVWRLAGPAFQTGHGTQVRVDSDELTFGHVLERRPRHNLQHVAVEGRQKA